MLKKVLESSLERTKACIETDVLQIWEIHPSTDGQALSPVPTATEREREIRREKEREKEREERGGEGNVESIDKLKRSNARFLRPFLLVEN